MKKAFTLAEIMIVLTVIGVLTAILLPVAFQAAPDENAMKFKKANSTLGTMIRELVNSDRYYANGDLGMRAGGAGGATGTQLKGTGTDADVDKRYFCMSLADIMSTKSVNCSNAAGNTSNKVVTLTNGNEVVPTETMVVNIKKKFDEVCADNTSIAVGPEIVSADNIVWYQASPGTPFGTEETYNSEKIRVFSPPNSPSKKPAYKDKYGFDVNYKVLCIDVDGINKDEPPFGYGIRADGRILPGERADEWAQKSVQKENN